jgi:hypothetical protein
VLVAHVGLGIWKRTWWVIAIMGAGTLLEVIGVSLSYPTS